MRGHGPSELAPSSLALLPLLPVVGLSACVASTGMDASTSPEQLRAAAQEPTWIEPAVERAPLTLLESAVVAGETSLAAGEFEAARELFVAATTIDPERPELRLAQVDALIGMRDYDSARALLTELRYVVEDADHDRRQMLMREREHAIGFASCDVRVESSPRSLARHDSFLSAWNELRAGLPRELEIPIPSDEDDAEGILCIEHDCREPQLVRLQPQGDAKEASLGLVLPHEDGSVSVLADVLHPAWDSCTNDTAVSLERHGHLLRVRAFTDERQEFDPADWDLDVSAGLGSMAQTGSSGYYGSGAGYGGSGYQGSGYQGSGYAYYGCGGGYGYDYDYDDGYESYRCTATRSLERDLFIDLRRGEVVLDIVRTGPTSSPLGEVGFDRGRVSVAACGVDESLQLSWAE